MSLLSSPNKVFEKRFCNRMKDFFSKIILLASVQFGFRSKNSCIHAISELNDFIRDTIDNKLKGQACFIDLKKAFDSLFHCQLHRKFYNCGFRSPIVDVPTGHLIDSWQYVFDKEHYMENFLVFTGVPQGSMLKLFLFLMYIKGLTGAGSSNCKMAFFLNNTSLLHSGKPYQSAI